MKKCLVFSLILLMSALGLFADDAQVMPARIGRFYLAPTFAFAGGGFDSDWKYEAYDSGEGSLKGFNLGFALEYGIIDWITAAVQWAPGITVASDVDMDLPYVNTSGAVPAAAISASDVNANGPADIFIGAKLQIVGKSAPVKSDKLRFAMATGVKVPLPGPDFEEQYENAVSGGKVTAANGDKHTLGVGVRGYFDYLFTDKFFLNLYGEFIGYPIKDDAKKAGYAEYFAIRGTQERLYYSTGIGGGGVSRWVDPEIQVQYGYDLTFEIEPIFNTPIGGGVIFNAGLPLNYSMNSGKTYAIETKSRDNTFKPDFEDALDQAGGGKTSATFSVKPNVSFFMTGWALPVEFKLQYGIPLVGQNGSATHALTLQIKAYFKI